jgi:hypothetical protein
MRLVSFIATFETGFKTVPNAPRHKLATMSQSGNGGACNGCRTHRRLKQPHAACQIGIIMRPNGTSAETLTQSASVFTLILSPSESVQLSLICWVGGGAKSEASANWRSENRARGSVSRNRLQSSLWDAFTRIVLGIFPGDGMAHESVRSGRSLF